LREEKRLLKIKRFPPFRTTSKGGKGVILPG